MNKQIFKIFFFLSFSIILLSAKPSLQPRIHTSQDSQTYTINFNNVSANEFVRFVSKICNLNFAFDEADLRFPISIVSEEPIPPSRILSSLVQILRIHGLSFVEEKNQIVIHKNPDVKLVSPIITDSSSYDPTSPVITRIFRLKNIKPETAVTILQPMISTQALLETCPETRHLIITDIPSNIDKIIELLQILDSSYNKYEIEIYQVKAFPPQMLIDLTKEILSPILEDNPCVMVPQLSANSIYIVSTPKIIEKVLSILTSLDTSKKIKATRTLKNENIFVYKLVNRTPEEIEEALNSIKKNFETNGYTDSEIITTIDTASWIKDTNSYIFIGTPDAIITLKEILKNVDTSSKERIGIEKTSFFVYKPINQNPDTLSAALEEMAENLASSPDADKFLIEALRSTKIIEATHSLFFAGEADSLSKIETLLKTIDIEISPTIKMGKIAFYLYKLHKASPNEIISSLKTTAENLKKGGLSEKGLVDTIKNVKYLKDIDSLLFTGDAPILKQIEEMMASFDTDVSKSFRPISSQFLTFKPTLLQGEELYQTMNEILQNLKTANLTDPAFIDCLQSMKWVPSSNTLLFTGNDDSLKKLESLLKTIDAQEISPPGKEHNFFLYHPQFTTPHQVSEYLKEIAGSLDHTKADDKSLIDIINKSHWIPQTEAFIFLGPQSTLNRLQEIIKDFDTTEKKTYFLYKLKLIPGNVIEEELDHFANKLRAQKIQKPALIELIDKMKWIKETNSLLLAGDPSAIEEAKVLIGEYDVPRKDPEFSLRNKFLMYEPKYLSPSYIENSLKDIAVNLEKADLADPDFLATIKSIKLVHATGSLIFTGTEESLAKIEEILKTIDIPKIAPGAATTIWTYKLQHATPQQIVSSLAAIATDLEQSSAPDKELIQALTSVKYDPTIKSLVFTGTPAALKKIKPLVEKFDIPAALEEVKPSSFYIYKPQFLSGPALENILEDFATHLKNTGFSDLMLFQTLQSIKWDEKTNSLIFTGDQKSIEEVKNLLATFDVPTKDGVSLKDIDMIDNTSFLVYKLQYHKGDEIQNALRQIATDMIKQNAPTKQSLLNAINSIQWIQVTNSLLCSGNQEIITRLKELIKNLDAPLKQVFIEMLVIETTFTNLLDFGLDWGSKLQYKGKFSASVSNMPRGTDTASSSQAGYFPKNLNDLTGAPTPQLMPFLDGGNLGIIGNIIMHKGKSFLSLGDLVTALQQDNQTTVVMTPKVITQDSKESKIFIGRNIPFIGSSTSNFAQNTTTTTNLEYRDIGMSLNLTPFLGNSDVVTLNVNLENSTAPTDPTGSIQFQAGTVQGITTTKTTMATTVHIPNKHFLILSGMVLDTKNRTKTGIPCLGSLPLIGAAFSEIHKTTERNNLVIFIRPHIINSYKDMKHLSETQEDYFREYAGTPTLEEDYDESIEAIKGYEDY